MLIKDFCVCPSTWWGKWRFDDIYEKTGAAEVRIGGQKIVDAPFFAFFFHSQSMLRRKSENNLCLCVLNCASFSISEKVFFCSSPLFAPVSFSADLNRILLLFFLRRRFSLSRKELRASQHLRLFLTLLLLYNAVFRPKATRVRWSIFWFSL